MRGFEEARKGGGDCGGGAAKESRRGRIKVKEIRT